MSAELAVVSVAAGLAVKACEKATELTVEAVWPRFLEQVQGMAIPEKWHGFLTEVGDRIQGQLPADVDNPFDNPEILAAIIAEEQEDPVVGATLNAVASQLPKIEIKTDRRQQQGIIFNDNAVQNVNEPITMNFTQKG